MPDSELYTFKEKDTVCNSSSSTKVVYINSQKAELSQFCLKLEMLRRYLKLCFEQLLYLR